MGNDNNSAVRTWLIAQKVDAVLPEEANAVCNDLGELHKFFAAAFFVSHLKRLPSE